MEVSLFAIFQTGQNVTTVHLFKNKIMLYPIHISLILANLGNANFGVNNINPNLCTHLIYSFAKLDPNTFDIVPWGDINPNCYLNLTALKSKNPSLKTIISIGGWADSNDGTQKY